MVCLILLGAVVHAIPVAAQEQGQAVAVERIEFSGLARTPESFARGLLRTRVGMTLDPQVLQGDVERLLRSGRFLSATYATEPTPRGVGVRFTVTERPVITSVEFEGNRKLGERKLRKLLTLKEGDIVDRFLLRESVEAIRNQYRQAGYGAATVTCDEQRADQTGEVVFLIEEGVQARVREIVFEGNTAFKDGVLRKQMKTKTAFWFLRKGTFDPQLVEGDVLKLQAYYRDRGYLDAQVHHRREVSEDGEDIALIFSIEEEALYHIEEIRFSGNTVYLEQELRALLGLQAGDVLMRQQLDMDVRAVQDHYGQYGYIYAGVRATPVFSATPGLVIVTFEVTENDQYRVGRIVPRGNTRTKDKVVLRAIDLYPPDDLLDMTEVKEAERRLRESGYFDTARVYPVGDEPGVRDLIVDVQEAEKIGDFLFGFGVTSNSGLVGNLVLDMKNFDLLDTPRTFSELIRFRAFHGAGQRLRLEFQPGTQVTRARIDFTEPYLWDRPLRFDLSGYLFTRGREGYDEQRTGMNVGLGKRIERGFWHGWAVEGALRAESVTIDEIDLFASGQARDVEGSNLITSLRGTVVRDRRDSRFLPTKGDRLRLGYEQVVGDFAFGKLTGGYTWYKTLHTDVLERPSVLMLEGETGYILGDSPLFERFYAGGHGSIRGFDFRGVGPRDGIDDTNVGGEFMLTLVSEYSFPLYGDSLRGLVFVDMGTVEEDFGISNWRASVGAGVRLTLNLFGPLPLEFNVGVPVLKDEDDDERLFSFFFGTAF